MNIKFNYSLLATVAMAVFFASCSKTESYSDLLKKEQRASNWFLAQHKVCNDIPADSIFITGSDAPYYKMDDDGYVYMQVIKANAKSERELPVNGAQVYFTFTRWNIESMYEGNTLEVASDAGNQDNFNLVVPETYFVFNNYSVSSSSQYGSGIQLPLSYLGYNSEVNIVLKSYYGFSSESTTCVPYKVNVRYFKAEY